MKKAAEGPKLVSTRCTIIRRIQYRKTMLVFEDDDFENFENFEKGGPEYIFSIKSLYYLIQISFYSLSLLYADGARL